MNKVIAAAVLTVMAGTSSAFAIQPIDGSLTSNARLEKAPVGSVMSHEFTSNGTDYRETYRVEADRSLKLVDREVSSQS
ncbi:hypothetical protein [Rhizobium sp. RU36D]|uniref:hypothetical protein n=1 Tax=Rhizobium sp. RU36D TaxID=1907415 RepID=UPI0009D7EBF0|nr:hypothetical protein [Rhizobium sp. RU36D]SMD09258.1 hypothetical protein SAMN05880593_120108 [Rhizobium sp. RU36D]